MWPTFTCALNNTSGLVIEGTACTLPMTAFFGMLTGLEVGFLTNAGTLKEPHFKSP